MKRFFTAIYSFVIAASCAYPYLKVLDYTRMEVKPFIYRQLSIQIIHFLQNLGMGLELSTVLVFGLGGVAFVFSLLYLLGNREWLAISLLFVFVLIFSAYPKPYDLLTATFFILAISFLQKRNIGMYLLVFVLSTLNRETTILLVPAFLIYCWKKVPAIQYALLTIVQGAIFFGIQAGIRYMFRNVPGPEAWMEPVHNLQYHLANPIPTIIFLTVLAILLWKVFQGWEKKPLPLRLSFLLLFPAFVALYIVFGQPYEYRVFAEVYPLAALLVVQ